MRKTMLMVASLLLLAVGPAWAETLIQSSNLIYLGAFRMPYLSDSMNCCWGADQLGGQGAYRAPRAEALNGSLYLIGGGVAFGQNIAEYAIPTLVVTTDVSQLYPAVQIQAPVEPTQGHYTLISPQGAGSGATVTGMFLQGNNLVLTVGMFYDANNIQDKSFFVLPRDLSQVAQETGPFTVGPSNLQGHLNGGQGRVNSRWPTLGGPAFGSSPTYLSIISRDSQGPSAWFYDPVTVSMNPSATPLLNYPTDHSTLGPWEGNNVNWGIVAEITGVVMPEGFDSVLFFGRKGQGGLVPNSVFGYACSCYETSTPSCAPPTLTLPPGSDPNCQDLPYGYIYDPESEAGNGHGPHAYPYVYYVWAYRASDLQHVKNGDINPATGLPWQPWEPVPYATWSLNLPFTARSYPSGIVSHLIFVAGYDAANNVIYLEQVVGDTLSGFGNLPVIHAFRFQ